MQFVSDRNLIINGLIVLILFSLWLGIVLRPLGESVESKVFVVNEGESFVDISNKLENEDLIRSSLAFKFVAYIRGQYKTLQPGSYTLFPSSSTLDILGKLARGDREEIKVRVPQGATIFEVDYILSNSGIVQPGEIIAEVERQGVAGELFPDTYKFFISSTAEDVVHKMKENFDAKTKDLFTDYAGSREEAIVMASLIEKEVPEHGDARVVAGIFWKRLKAGMPLQIDASICHPKLEKYFNQGRVGQGCGPITRNDLKMDSPYNTYLNKGLPPGPIGSPGLISLESAVHPSPSPHWFYLSDPRTGKTIFSRDFDEHRANINRYLR
jgi:UPF0755 protein